jgi:hypothetical protein
MCAPDGDDGGKGRLNPPLGWSLSRVAGDKIEVFLGEGCNGAAINALLERLFQVSHG